MGHIVKGNASNGGDKKFRRPFGRQTSRRGKGNTFLEDVAAATPQPESESEPKSESESESGSDDEEE
jgi:hypothetical protein